ncbi:MAG: hypothetical protein ACE5JO_12015 [Candidatus Binatia bacterium]
MGTLIPSLQCLLGWNSSLLASGSIETRQPKDMADSDIDAANPPLRREFQRLGANLRSGTEGSLVWKRVRGGETEERRRMSRKVARRP